MSRDRKEKRPLPALKKPLENYFNSSVFITELHKLTDENLEGSGLYQVFGVTKHEQESVIRAAMQAKLSELQEAEQFVKDPDKKNLLAEKQIYLQDKINKLDVPNEFQKIKDLIDKNIFEQQKGNTKGETKVKLEALRTSLKTLEEEVKSGTIKDISDVKKVLDEPLNEVNIAAIQQQKRQLFGNITKNNIAIGTQAVMKELGIEETKTMSAKIAAKTVPVFAASSAESSTVKQMAEHLQKNYGKDPLPKNTAFMLLKENDQGGVNVNVVVTDNKGQVKNVDSRDFYLVNVELDPPLWGSKVALNLRAKVTASRLQEDPKLKESLMSSVQKYFRDTHDQEPAIANKDTKFNVVTDPKTFAHSKVAKLEAPPKTKAHEPEAPRSFKP